MFYGKFVWATVALNYSIVRRKAATSKTHLIATLAEFNEG